MNDGSTEKINDTDADTVNSSNKKGGTSEAGVLRGVARSLGRGSAQKGISILRMPAIGRLPVAGPSPTAASKILFRGPKVPIPTPKVVVPTRVATDFIPRSIPVKQVAKVSDHVSQGISFLDSASESSSSSSVNTGKRNVLYERILQLRTFASSLIKNTVLGITVFEVYGGIVDTFTPVPSPYTNKKAIFDYQIYDSTTGTWPLQKLSSSTYSQASVGIHMLGGFVGGSAHGVIATLWDAISMALQQRPNNVSWNSNATTLHGILNPNLIVLQRKIPGMIAHHGISHAVLFGSYEVSKRLIYSNWISGIRRDVSPDQGNLKDIKIVEPMVRWEYLASVAIAGGFAGQAQHVVSHFTERKFLTHAEVSLAPFQWRTLLFPFAMAFLPSSIAFVAFEYGQSS